MTAELGQIKKILVLKFGALGDFVQALAVAKRIRLAHPNAHITLLTTPPFEALAKASPYFDAVETDGRPRKFGQWLAMVRRVRRARYDRVYDLQTSNRSGMLFQVLRPFPPQWSGIARGCDLPHRNPDRNIMHTLERQADQLKDAGIWPDAPVTPGSAPPADLSWIIDSVPDPRPAGSKPYALFVPGGSAHRLDKRWPTEFYAELAALLVAQGLDVIVLGGPEESALAQTIQAKASVEDLTGRTSFSQIAALGARAALAVGNDTGPTHLIAAAGAPTVALFSHASDPALCAPRGKVTVLRREFLDKLPVSEVAAACAALIRGSITVD